jgi:hypothetical protein
MRVLLAMVVSVYLLVVAETPAAFAGTCGVPSTALDCVSDCTSSHACLLCCASTGVSTATCRTACSSVRAATPTPRVITNPQRPRPTRAVRVRPSRPQHPQHPTAGPAVDPTRLLASCHMEQSLDRVVVSLEVTNNTGGTLTNLVATNPLVQIEAGTAFTLANRSSPRAYAAIPQGTTLTFQWQGRLRSSGAVGVAAAASAVAPNGALVDTPQADCGTLGGSSPDPTTPGTSIEAAQCANCHEAPHMAFVANKWLTGAHASTYGAAQGNTYCARCHAPLQATAVATTASNRPIAPALWQAVTCSVCHPPDAQQTEWQTPIALYDVATRTYAPVAIADADVLCTHCHTGEFAPGFQGYGAYMHYSGVRCIDCHMAKIPAADAAIGRRAAHDFKVATNLPYSCGTFPGGCHARRSEAWATRILELGPMHMPGQGE